MIVIEIDRVRVCVLIEVFFCFERVCVPAPSLHLSIYSTYSPTYLGSPCLFQTSVDVVSQQSHALPERLVVRGKSDGGGGGGGDFVL